MKVRVAVKEVSYGSVVVEVDKMEDAYDAAYDAYENGEVFWNKSDFDIITTEEE